MRLAELEDLFSDVPGKEEVVTLFIALLEILKLGKAHVRQGATFDTILVVPGGKETDAGEDDGAE